MHELANSTLYTPCAWTSYFNAIYPSKSWKAEVVNMVHECEIYEGGWVLELGYAIPKLLRTFSQSSMRVMMTRNSKLNTGTHNQHFIKNAINQYFSARHVNCRCMCCGKGMAQQEFNQMLDWGWSKSWGQYLAPSGSICSMMTSSDGNIFHVTGLLCGEFTGPRWIPRTKASDAELWCYL